MFETQLVARDTQGSQVAVLADVDGQLKTSSGATITSISTSVETKQVSGFADSVYVVGSADSMLVYQARTTNPTATSDGGDVRPSADDLGRQLITPYQVRDLVTTAYVSLTTGTEASLLAAGGSGVFHDLVEVTFANTSTGAITVDLRDATAGGIVKTFRCPGDQSSGATFNVPVPQNAANLPWTADMDDVSNSTVNVSATFIKNV